MLLLSADSLLLLFITMNLGILTRNMLGKVFRCTVISDLLGTFLLGLLFSSVYFNILSFWLPVNYLSLIPLAALSGVVFFTNQDSIGSSLLSVRQYLKYFSARPRLMIFLCVLAVLFFYWILPPANFDSLKYHYQCILWYEKYKVVPGLANIQGRFAFNPVSFIIQAAYSFTGPAGQSLYPLNGVLTALFSGWLLIRLFKAGGSVTGLFYAILIILFFRLLLANISSPSSDTLVVVCVSYALISLFEVVYSRELSLSRLCVPGTLLLFSLTAKLSSFPVLLALPFIFYWLPRKERSLSLFLKFSLMALILFIPWLGRNYILSGYLVYPIPSLGWLHPDWQAPPGVLKLDLFYIGTATKTNGYDWPLSTPLPLNRWFVSWFIRFFRDREWADPLIFAAGILSPAYWFLRYRKEKAFIPEWRPFFGWLVVYAGVWMWLLTSPIIRYGSVLLYLSMAFPILAFFYRRPQREKEPYRFLIRSLFAGAALYFIATGCLKPTTYRFTLADCWLYPLKDKAYNNRGTKDFAYKTLRPGVKLYIAAPGQECINTCLPCMESFPWSTVCYYDEIEMRGSRIDDGFRMIRDEVPFNYPFIK